MLTLLGMIAIAIPVTLIYLLVSHAGLKRRVAELEAQLSVHIHATRRPATLADAEDRDEEPGPDPEPAAPATRESTDSLPGPWEVAREADPDAPPDVRTPPSSPRTPPVPRGPSRMDRLLAWLGENWIYVISATCLALAGVFLVQYGSERGLLPPPVRVAAALVFGAALIGGGEWLRRRYGDDEGAATTFLPSVFAGAGVVSIFAGVLAARMLYDLIGAEVAMLALVASAALAVGLGWFYGPLLAAVGLIGATLAPFVVGGDSDAPYWLYAYFGLIAVIGLFIDALRRWAWVSILALALAFVAAGILHLGTGGGAAFVAMAGLLSLAALGIPVLSLAPQHDGPMMSDLRRGAKSERPFFPTWLAAGGLLAACGTALLVASADGLAFWTAVVTVALLAAALILWCRFAPALADLSLLPVVTFWALIAQQSDWRGEVYRAFRAGIERAPETAWPREVSVLVAIATLLSLLAAWRSLRQGRWPRHWAAAAALIAPGTVVLFEVTWRPADVMGAYPWALHATALAILSAAMATRFANQDAADRMRPAFAALAALSMMTLALVLILSDSALTVALAVTLLAAAALDRRFDLPPLGWFVQAAVIVLGYRLVLDPGLDFATGGPLIEVLLVYVTAIAAMAAAFWLLRPLPRQGTRIVLETGMMGQTGVLLSVLAYRAIAATSGSDAVNAHWALALDAVIWLALAYAQFDRMRAGGWLRRVRLGIGCLFALIGGVFLLGAVVFANPLLTSREVVLGPVVLNSLIVAYLMPGVLVLLAARRLGLPGGWVRKGLVGIGAGLIVLWLGLMIRHIWQGPVLASPGVTQGENLSYTFAMLTVGAGLLYQSIASGSRSLRRVALGVIQLCVVKAFFIDIAGLSGLMRVVSLLAVGLTFAALAWFDRWAASGATSEPESEAEPETED